MTTVHGKTFRSGNSEAVRLPKEIAFGEGVELVIVRTGDVVTMYPAKGRTKMQELAERLRRLPKPESIEVRDTEELPERPGL